MVTARKKRVLIFSYAYFPFVGGAEIAIKEITERLRDGFDFVLITRRFARNLPRIEKIGNVEVYRVAHLWKMLFPVAAFFMAMKLNRRKSFDLSWSVMINASFANLFFKMTRRDVPFVLTIQEGDTPEHIKRRVLLVWPLFKKLFRKVEAVTAISNFLVNFVKQCGYKGEPILLPNGVDLELFKSAEQYQRQSFSKPFRLITTSRLSKKNGLEFVILALPQLPNVLFQIIGAGEEEMKLKKLAEKVGVSGRVQFLGYLDHRESVSYLQEADAFIRPSLSEGMGISFIESMSVGLPTIGTPVGGIVDFIEDKKTGFFCRPKDPESIVRVIKYIMENEEEAFKIAEAGGLLVQEKYGWDKISAGYGKLFSSLTKQHGVDHH